MGGRPGEGYSPATAAEAFAAKEPVEFMRRSTGATLTSVRESHFKGGVPAVFVGHTGSWIADGCWNSRSMAPVHFQGRVLKSLKSTSVGESVAASIPAMARRLKRWRQGLFRARHLSWSLGFRC